METTEQKFPVIIQEIAINDEEWKRLRKVFRTDEIQRQTLMDMLSQLAEEEFERHEAEWQAIAARFGFAKGRPPEGMTVLIDWVRQRLALRRRHEKDMPQSEEKGQDNVDD